MSALRRGDASAPSPWPGGCQGAVSLTFDDGLPTHLTAAIPIMEDHGVRGTFYIPPRGDDWARRLAPWRAVAKAGHELGNHSLSHTCSQGFFDARNGTGLETMTLEALEADIVEAERRLRELAPEQTARSFAYPCYQDHVGEGLTRRSYVPVIARHFVAGRGKGEIPNHPATCDLHYAWSWPVERFTGAELVGLAERAAAQGRWGILTMHGVHQGHLSVADVDLKELCAFLERHRERIWTAPVATVAQRIAEWRKQVGIA